MIANQLEQVGISAQCRNSLLKCHKLLNAFEKELKQPLKSGTEPKLCEEMNQLLHDVSVKRKEESASKIETAKAKKDAKAVKKTKERIATEVEAGKVIREASLTTMKRKRGKCITLPRPTYANTMFI